VVRGPRVPGGCTRVWWADGCGACEERRQEMHPEDRPLEFVPRKYRALRQVPMYPQFIRERFDRCLDLYLCPRAIKRKLQVDPDTLLPKLPDPKELRPFPTTMAVHVSGAPAHSSPCSACSRACGHGACDAVLTIPPRRPSMQYSGHTGRVRAMSVDPTGQVRGLSVDCSACERAGRCVDQSSVASALCSGSSRDPTTRRCVSGRWPRVVAGAASSWRYCSVHAAECDGVFVCGCGCDC
jgi:hypothetical protein